MKPCNIFNPVNTKVSDEMFNCISCYQQMSIIEQNLKVKEAQL